MGANTDKVDGELMVLGLMIKRAAIWWKFKKLDRTYQPLLEKAMAFGNREALLKLEEQYWHKCVCLIEERREIRQTAHASHPRFGAATPSLTPPVPPNGQRNTHFGSELDLVDGKSPASPLSIMLFLLIGTLMGIGGILFLTLEFPGW